MAGAGFKTFATGDVLTASDVNTYLMQQTVMVFASSAARSTALGGNVAQGMISYLKDSNTTAYYDGTAWQTLSTGGDITSVTTAGNSGLAGGATSGDVALKLNTAAKGDLMVGTGSGTASALTAGSDGSILVANSAASTGLGWAGNFVAGRNKIINGDFGIWQRGTSFSPTSGIATYTADRWMAQLNFSSGTSTVTQQTFTPASAPVAGYEGQYYLRLTNSAGGTNAEIQQRIEDVRTFAGQTVTISFWAKASSSVTMANTIIQNFGTGGSSSLSTTGTSQTLSTSWARYSTTIAVPSISGKTVGTSSFIQVYPIYYSSGTIASNVIDIWGVQLEAGSVATPFQTATGTIQGELAACQRYYIRLSNVSSSGANYEIMGTATTTSIMDLAVQLPVTLRTTATAMDYTNLGIYVNRTAATQTSGTFTLQAGTPQSLAIRYTHGSAIFNAGADSAWLVSNTAATNYVGFSAEL